MVDMYESSELQVIEPIYSPHKSKKKKKIEIKNLRAHNYRSRTSYELVNLEPCPRSVDDVYALGIRLQYYIGAVYLELDGLNKGSNDKTYINLAIRQLEGKDLIEKLVNDNLNRLLGRFYNEYSEFDEYPVSEQVADKIQPFFNRVMANLLYQLDVMMNMTAKGDISSDDLEDSINNNMIALYTVLGKLFQAEEIKNSFNELISIRKAYVQKD
jgi:hypothetical protein